MTCEIGDVLNGTVERKVSYGAFLELETGERGLLHVSQLRGNSGLLKDDRLNALAKGSEVVVEVINVEAETGRKQRRISLSEKAIHDDIILNHLSLLEPHRGVVSQVVSFGAFVLIPEWYTSGLLHVSRMTGSCRKARDQYHAGLEAKEQITVYVREIDFEKNLRLSLTQIEPPLEAFECASGTRNGEQFEIHYLLD